MENLDPAILQAILEAGKVPTEEAILAEQMKRARAQQASPLAEGTKVGDFYVAANPLQHALAAMERIQGRRSESSLSERQRQLAGVSQRGREAMLKAVPSEMPDYFGIMAAPDDATAEERAKATLSALRGQRQLGMAGALSGDPTMGKVGGTLIGEASEGQQAIGQAGQARLKMALSAEEARQRRAKEEADRALRERSVASQEDYRRSSLGLQGARLGLERQRVGLEEARLGMGGAGAGGEENAITLKARAIMEGRQPPEMKGLYRMALPVSAELEKQGFDLSKAQMQWDAQKRLVSSLNGPQQVRLGQATRMVSESLGKVDELYQNWKRQGIASDFPTLNRADLALAIQQGGPRGAAAQALTTLINDLILEQATVLMGGNAPTEQAMKHAEQNLQAQWGGRTFDEALKLVKFNTNARAKIMSESSANIGSGSSEPNPYAKRGPAGEGTTERQATHRFNPATGKIEAVQ